MANVLQAAQRREVLILVNYKLSSTRSHDKQGCKGVPYLEKGTRYHLNFRNLSLQATKLSLTEISLLIGKPLHK